MVHHAVDHGGRHLVVAEDLAPPRELEVGRDHHRLPLVGLRDHLEQQARPVDVERQEPQLVDDEHAGPAYLGELAVEPVLVARAAQAHHERGGGEEAGLDPGLARQRAQRARHVRLAAADVAHEDEVLAPLQEGERQQVGPPEAVRPRHGRPVVAVEGLGRRQRAAPEQRRPLRRLAARALRLEVGGQVLDLLGAPERRPLAQHRRRQAAGAARRDDPGGQLAGRHLRHLPFGEGVVDGQVGAAACGAARGDPPGGHVHLGVPGDMAARERLARRLARRIEPARAGGPRYGPEHPPAPRRVQAVDRVDKRRRHVAAHGRLAEGAGPGHERRDERQGAPHGLALAEGPGQLGDAPAAVRQDLHAAGAHAHGEAPVVPGGPGQVEPAVDGHVAALVGPRRDPPHRVEGRARQRRHRGEVLGHRLGRRAPVAAPGALVDAPAPLGEPGVELGERGRPGHRHQQVPPQEAHGVLDGPFSRGPSTGCSSGSSSGSAP